MPGTKTKTAESAVGESRRAPSIACGTQLGTQLVCGTQLVSYVALSLCRRLQNCLPVTFLRQLFAEVRFGLVCYKVS
jgi:hypothetical protein